MEIYDFGDPTNLVELDRRGRSSPPGINGYELGAEEQRIARRQKLAELMLQARMNPGPIYSKGAAIANAIGGAIAGMDLRNAEAQSSDLAKRMAGHRKVQYDKLAELLASDAAKQKQGAAQLLGSTDPTLQKTAFSILTREPPKPEAFTLKPGERRFQGDKVVAEAPAEPEKAPEAVRSLEAFLKGAGIDPQSETGKALYAAAAKRATTHQPATTVNVGDKGEGEFWKQFGKSQAEGFEREQEQAKGAAQMIQSTRTARELLSKGIYTGTAADWRLAAGKALKQAGFNMNEDDIANTEAFISTMGQQVLAGIKQLGAGSAISNADREFMEKVVGGKLTLDAKGIERILAITEQVSHAKIAAYNKKAKGIQGKAPAGFLPYSLEVETPTHRTVDDIMKLYGGQP